MHKKSGISRLIPAIAGALIALAPALSFAERPFVDCNSIDPSMKAQIDNELSEKFYTALDEDADTAIVVAQEILSICSEVSYAYNLGSLYQNKKDMANACYYYDFVLKHEAEAKKNNEDVYKALEKKYKKIKDICEAFTPVSVECAQNLVSLSITGEGVAMHHVACPFYGYMGPGTYAVKASKQGFTSASAELAVVEGTEATLQIDELEDPKARGHIEIKCPRGSTGFSLTNAKGKTTEYTCPYIGDVPAGTYTLKLSDTDGVDPQTIVVEKQGNLMYEVPGAIQTSCSATPLSQSSAPLFAGALALLAALGFAVRRRRDAE